jgi:hypothetical protein
MEMVIAYNGRSPSREFFFGGVWPSSDELSRELQVHDPSQALDSSQVKETRQSQPIPIQVEVLTVLSSGGQGANDGQASAGDPP